MSRTTAIYLLSWLLLAVVGVANGILRVATYGRHVSELAAHQLSTLSAIALTGIVVRALARLRPLQSGPQAWAVGVAWLLMTILFEFAFGRCVAGHSWQRLLADYDLLGGRLWPLFLLWLAVMPYVFFRLGSGASR